MVQDVIAPFVPMALDVNVEQENTVNCRYLFRFEGYEIYLYWDRAIIKTDGEIKHLKENNSIIEEPFFNLFNKIKELSAFGTVLNCLCVTVFINHTDKKQTEIVEEFANKFLLIKNTEKLISKPSDICLVLEKNINEKQLSIQYGPYLGMEDLKKRGVVTKNREILTQLDKLGEMAEVKIFEPLHSITFAKYKEYLKMALMYQDEIWKI
jgi:hypothetical protein